ncbi:MAG: hypothetical protein N2509_01405 [Treponemataceae bacterium]|jgi:hypothetical protein|nr:hypothetical protein [Treponemataceae bacterium]HOK00182.1 hypothetical protein [Termitinemataceae bacterium]HOM23363.1 hypothetical protein [Termitinemataceae bacterium]HPQ00131.1 hypothetical protein [Termitinemataceae bacterium]
MIEIREQRQYQRHSIEELKHLINDERYVTYAIQRIAQVLTEELMALPDQGEDHERS